MVPVFLFSSIGVKLSGNVEIISVVSICCEVGPDCVWEKELDCVVDGFVVACFVVVVGGGGGGTVVMEANVEVVVFGGCHVVETWLASSLGACVLACGDGGTVTSLCPVIGAFVIVTDCKG